MNSGTPVDDRQGPSATQPPDDKRRIWLTGASSGIGAALAETLLRQGHHLVLTARRPAPLEALAGRYPTQTMVMPGDLTDPEQVREIGKRIAAHWGVLDCAILNAGTCEYMDVREFEAAMVERVMRANLFSAAYCLEAALPLLRRATRPQLVAMASSAALFSLPRAEAYGSSKAALRYLFESLRMDLAAEDIAITVISPGFVDTPLTRNNDFPMPMRWDAQRAARHIADRLGSRPMEIAFPRLFIAALRFLGCLPPRLQVAVGRRLSRNREPA